MRDVNIVAYWRNDQDTNRFMITCKGLFDDEKVMFLREAYKMTVEMLDRLPEYSKKKFIENIEAFAVTAGIPGENNNPTTEEFIESYVIVFMIAALEKKGMIVSDEYNGVIGLETIGIPDHMQQGKSGGNGVQDLDLTNMVIEYHA